MTAEGRPVGTGSRTVADLLPLAAERYGTKAAARQKVEGRWQEDSYSDLLADSERVARGLIGLGLRPGERVAILAQTRAEWTSCCFAVLLAGGSVVTLYPTNSATECEYVLAHSEARFLFVEDAAQLTKISPLKPGLPSLEEVMVIDPAGVDSGLALSLSEVGDRGADVEPGAVRGRCEAVRPEDPCVYLYTSGTTGPPKGCEITHWNVRSMLSIAAEDGLIVGADLAYLYLPLAHAFGLLILLLSIDVGATVAYWSRDPKKVIADLGEVQPTFFPSVPRIFEKLHALALRPDGTGAEVAPAERLRELIGPRIRYAMTGAAPIAMETLEFFHANGVPVLEAYGTSEMSPLVSMNTLDAYRFGSVGRVISGVDARIAEDGELLLRGPNLFAGYFKDPGATAEAIVDGWLRTGDMARIDDDGYLWITGRKKEIIITAGGKNVSPANIEVALKRSPRISQAVVIGDRRPYLVALITLEPEEALALAAERGLAAEEVATSDAMRAEIEATVKAANAMVGPVEQVKRFRILSEDLSQANGELTPTQKVKRAVVEQRYANVIDGLYGSLDDA